MEDNDKYLWAPTQKEEDYTSDPLSEHAQQYAKQKAAEQVIRQTQADITKKDKTKAGKALQILSSGPNGRAVRSLIPGAALTAVGLPEIGVPMMAGAGVDQAVKTYTPYESVGDGVAQSLGIRPYNKGYGAVSFAGEFLNPGFMVSPNMATKAVNYLTNAPKATIEANAVGRMNDAAAQRAIDAQVPLNYGWGPKQTLNVTRAGAYDQMYYPQRWDAVQEGANPNGVWLQGKLGTPRTEETNPGKGIKAARARNTFATRPEQYRGTATFNKPMVTVGDTDRSALSYFADSAGADGIIYNDIYDNGYNSNQVILSFKPQNITKRPALSERERLGITKEDWNILNEISPEISLSDFNRGITDPQQQLELLRAWRKRYPDAPISKPSDIIDKEILQDLYTNSSSVLPKEARAVNGEMIKKLYQTISEVTGLPINKITNEKFAEVVDKNFIDIDKLTRFLKSFDNAYLNDYARILESPEVPNTIKEQYAKRIRGMMKYLPMISLSITGLSTLNNEDILSNKFGGILKRIETGKSGIKIKSKNKGKFTETKKRTGKTTEELTHSKNPLTRKRAVFAQNAKKWNHK